MFNAEIIGPRGWWGCRNGLEVFKREKEGEKNSKLEYLWVYGNLNITEIKK